MSPHLELLRKVPSFPNYSSSLFGYPERCIQNGMSSLIVLGPPIHLYNCLPSNQCTIHASGFPDWATISDIAEIFEQFGKIYSIELSVTIDPKKRIGVNPPHCNGWALITYVSFESTQKALFAHLTRRIPGMCTPISIYKGCCSNVVLLKNLPSFLSKADILSRINSYQGLVSISFIGVTTARMVFEDLDYALLFMDLVSAGGLVIEGYTCAVEPEDRDEIDDFDN
ncbi:unnamed protein product [Orchesella dallaii]|uniref:RRM domain-containing protein n=1 Tax=Orchesella dallaii TaxID=48710 RepID=A0ABP1RAE9_9HEXA